MLINRLKILFFFCFIFHVHLKIHLTSETHILLDETPPGPQMTDGDSANSGQVAADLDRYPETSPLDNNADAPKPEPDSDSDSDYLSFDESDNEESDHHDIKAEREAREHERQLVLEAAGLIVNQDVKPPPRLILMRNKSNKKRRPPPTAPRLSSRASTPSMKELPPVPPPGPESETEPDQEPIDHARRLDDAFDRYESFRKNQGTASNRMSVASSLSLETVPASPTTSTMSSAAPSQSREGESRSYSSFLHFLGRSRTPVEGEKRTTLNISGPITHISNDPSRTNSPAFGTVCHPCR